MLKTKDYDIFKIRKDNRPLIPSHVEGLKRNISKNNLLHTQPLLCNAEMEVIDGQNRLQAARELDVEVYYIIDPTLTPASMITVNATKRNWSPENYMNYYLYHGYEDYKKLNEFCVKNEINLSIGINIFCGSTHEGLRKFRDGEMKVDDSYLSQETESCWDTIRHIRKVMGYQTFLNSTRFWKGLLLLCRHPFFDKDKWMENLQLKIDSIGPRASFHDYTVMLQNIYNFRNQNKISIKKLRYEDEV